MGKAIEFHQRYLLVSGLNLMGISESQDARYCSSVSARGTRGPAFR